LLVKLAWDEAKNRENQQKYKVSFEEASELFRSGDDYLEIFDEEHSVCEDRLIAIGPIRRGLILIVWTERDEDTVRIMSARWAEEPERALYRAYMEELP
jgi:uncharacterized DUF497 family protein